MAIARLTTVLDEGVVAANVELKHAQGVGRGLGGLLQPRLGHRAQHVGGAERTGTARDGRTRSGIEHLQRADRRQHDRQAQFAAEHLDRRVDLGDVAQHARPERNLVERHAVAAHGRLGLGGADDIVPGVLIEVRARLAHELVKVLELLAARAEFDGHRLDGRPVIHGVSLPCFGDNSRCRRTGKAAARRRIFQAPIASPAPLLIKQPMPDKDT